MSEGFSVKAIRARTLAIVPCAVWERIVKPSILLPYYHMVSDGDVVHTKHLYAHKNIEQFVNDLEFILRRYRPISLSELIEHIAKGRPLAKKVFHLSFDDGFREMAEIVAPILSRKGVPATFFINTAFIDNKKMCYLNKASLIVEHVRNAIPVSAVSSVLKALKGVYAPAVSGDNIEGRILAIKYDQQLILDEVAGLIDLDCKEYLDQHAPYLTTDQVRGLVRNGFAVGSHSIDHPKYSMISIEEQIRQTLNSLHEIRGRFGLGYGAFAFPHTDKGVTKEFFERIYDSDLIDVSFGTRGLFPDPCPKNLQRINFEKPMWPADKLISYYCGKQFFKRIVGRDKAMSSLF